MAQKCKICKVQKGRRHKMSCDYYKYNQPVVWQSTVDGSTIMDSGSSFNDHCSSSSSSFDSGSSSSCDSGGF